MSYSVGTIIEIFVEGGTTRALVNTAHQKETVPLTLIMDARVGDMVKVRAGMAVGIMPQQFSTVAS